MLELVPAFASVAVHYDPARVPDAAHGEPGHSPYERFGAAVNRVLAELEEGLFPAAHEVTIPVCYGGAYGPDLDDVAQAHGLTAEEVVRQHSGAAYSVYMLGFAPGFAYLGGLPEAIATPRRPEPRMAVPAGSVGIGGNQTGVYPLVSPGGWNLIGRTPVRMFDARRNPPSLLAAGDSVRFTPITPDEFQRVGSAVPA